MKMRQLAASVAYHALGDKFGSRLLRFADEDRGLDNDALYQLWAESDSRCWVDTEQQAKAAPVPGLPLGTEAVVGDSAMAPVPPVGHTEFAESSGYGEDLSLFQSEIDTWRQRRAPTPKAPPAVAHQAAQPAGALLGQPR